MIETRIEGADLIKEVAAQMRAEGHKDLSRDMGAALVRAQEPVKDNIRDEASDVMPTRGGYQATFLASLRFATSRRFAGQAARLILRTFADGAGERRDIRALEGGRLRHPVFGRSRSGARKGERIANPWAVTSIRSGFHERGVAGALVRSQEELIRVIREYADRLIK